MYYNQLLEKFVQLFLNFQTNFQNQILKIKFTIVIKWIRFYVNRFRNNIFSNIKDRSKTKRSKEFRKIVLNFSSRKTCNYAIIFQVCRTVKNWLQLKITKDILIILKTLLPRYKSYRNCLYPITNFAYDCPFYFVADDLH